MSEENPRPRSFAWVSRNGEMYPQIIFEDPRVGSGGFLFAAERHLAAEDHGLTLDQLAAKYPAPAQNGDAQ